MSVGEASRISLERHLGPLITHEMAGIAAIDVAIAHESAADYVAMFRDARSGKQANVEQMATLVRMYGRTPDESGGVRATLTRMRASIASRFNRTISLETMRAGEIELIARYSDAITQVDGLARRALRKALGRALVHTLLLTAHLAKRIGSEEAEALPAPLGEYFAGGEPHACMRCHLDRPGASSPLERTDPHPYTYLCAACHDEVLAEFPSDLATQMDRWPREAREAKVLQRGLGLVSRLNAIGRVLHPLAGLEPELPTPAAERAVIVPSMTPTPRPAPAERHGMLTIEKGEGPEGDYVDRLFAPRQVWSNW